MPLSRYALSLHQGMKATTHMNYDLAEKYLT